MKYIFNAESCFKRKFPFGFCLVFVAAELALLSFAFDVPFAFDAKSTSGRASSAATITGACRNISK